MRLNDWPYFIPIHKRCDPLSPCDAVYKTSASPKAFENLFRGKHEFVALYSPDCKPVERGFAVSIGMDWKSIFVYISIMPYIIYKYYGVIYISIMPYIISLFASHFRRWIYCLMYNLGMLEFGISDAYMEKMMDLIYRMVNGYMEWLMDIWIGLRKCVILSPPPDY